MEASPNQGKEFFNFHLDQIKEGSTLLHRYFLFKKLGVGATSEVYLGRDIETKATYAIKILTRNIEEVTELDKI